MMAAEIEQKLALLARRVWAGRGSDTTLRERLLRDPASFLRENGIAIPEAFETEVSAGADAVSFRFRPRKEAVDVAVTGEGAPELGDGSMVFRFEFQWIWD
jgi:hypothetical protein